MTLVVAQRLHKLRTVARLICSWSELSKLYIMKIWGVGIVLLCLISALNGDGG
jgi:hypothetical protein